MVNWDKCSIAVIVSTLDRKKVVMVRKDGV